MGFIIALIIVVAPIYFLVKCWQSAGQDYKEAKKAYQKLSVEQKASISEKDFISKRIYRKNATAEEILDVPKLVTCPLCGQQVSNKAAACPKCGQPIAEAQCPICGSKNVKVVSSTEKFGSMVMWGSLSANKVLNKYECQDCHHKF